MLIKWTHTKPTFIIFKGKRNKSIRNQSHLPTNAYNRIKSCTSILKLCVSAAGHHSQVIHRSTSTNTSIWGVQYQATRYQSSTQHLLAQYTPTRTTGNRSSRIT